MEEKLRLKRLRWLANGCSTCIVKAGLAMVNVLLPLDASKLKEMHLSSSFSSLSTSDNLHTTQDADVNPPWAEHVRAWIGSRFIQEHHTSVPILYWSERFWTRLSGQIYLEMDDFEEIGRQMAVLCARVMKGEHLEGSRSVEEARASREELKMEGGDIGRVWRATFGYI